MRFLRRIFVFGITIYILTVIIWILTLFRMILNQFPQRSLSEENFFNRSIEDELDLLAMNVGPGNSSNLTIDCFEQPSSCTFLVNGRGCSIPYYEPFHKDVKKYLKIVKVTCNHKSFVFADGEVLRINKEALEMELRLADPVKCSIYSFARQNNFDNWVRELRVLRNFKRTYTSKDEFLKVQCTFKSKIIYEDFFVFMRPKPEVETRCDEAWQKHHLAHKRDPATRSEHDLSLLLIGFDSMSHLNFLRKMPKSYEILKHSMSAIELQGITKLADNTLSCLIPMLTGKFVSELKNPMGPFDDEPFLWKSFKENGYRTLYGEDSPWISMFNVNYAKGFFTQPTDYYLRPFYLGLESSYMRNGDERQHCFNSRLEVSVVFEWLLQFIRLFKTKPYFAFTFFTRLFHGLMNEPQNADQVFQTFLLQAVNTGLLNHTVLMVFSDHGLRSTGFSETPMGKYESKLPLFLIVFPQWFYKKYQKLHRNLLINQRRLTTLFDVHELIKDLLNFTGEVKTASTSSRGISLFNEISLQRTCENASINPHWCMCKKYYPLSVNEDDVRITAKALVEKINSLTEMEPKKCAKLSLGEILSAQVYNTRTDWSWIQVTFETHPGNGHFEGTAKFNSRTRESLPTSEFSRTNLYGNQSHCVNDTSLRIFCYCV